MQRDRTKQNYNALPRKILFTLGIICFYILGRNVPLPWVEVSEGTAEATDAMLVYTAGILGHDVSRGSVFSLGIGPWITSSIMLQLVSSIFDNSERIISRTILRRITLIFTLIMAIIQALVFLGDATFSPDAFPYLWETQLVTVFILVTGAFVVVVLAENNTRYGVGGTSALILVNILTTLRVNLIEFLSEPEWSTVTNKTILLWAVIPAVYLILVVLLTVLFEKSELRIPVFRVMIRNDLADENYIAIKLNPAGTMPVMFAMTFFMIPYYVVELLLGIWKDNASLLTAKDLISLDNYFGIWLYLLMAVLLNLGFSFININPRELSKQYMESGDCLAGKRPGKETRKYIDRCIILCVVLSCIMQCSIVGIPLFIKTGNGLDSKIFQMPMTMIILTGIILNVTEEIRVINNFRDYKAFL